jgi:hypothetical protein
MTRRETAMTRKQLVRRINDLITSMEINSVEFPKGTSKEVKDDFFDAMNDSITALETLREKLFDVNSVMRENYIPNPKFAKYNLKRRGRSPLPKKVELKIDQTVENPCWGNPLEFVPNKDRFDNKQWPSPLMNNTMNRDYLVNFFDRDAMILKQRLAFTNPMLKLGVSPINYLGSNIVSNRLPLQWPAERLNMPSNNPGFSSYQAINQPLNFSSTINTGENSTLLKILNNEYYTNQQKLVMSNLNAQIPTPLSTGTHVLAEQINISQAFNLPNCDPITDSEDDDIDVSTV